MDDIRGRVFDDNAKKYTFWRASKRSRRRDRPDKRYAALVAEEAGKYDGERRRELERMAGSLRGSPKIPPARSGSRSRPY
jgi:hypothetical protein